VPLFSCTVRLIGSALLALLILVPAESAETPRTVTLDVKDGEVHDIFREIQKQCAIRNLVIDPGVEGKGTFLFRDVPCPAALDVVGHTMGLQVVDEGNSVVSVRRRQ
jgi:hypothetical protein